jgi:phage terminase Nu1 subunit (DNA packaging protein)
MAEKITKETTVSLSELAVVLGITSKQVRNLTEDGIIVTDGKNSYPLARNVQAYMAFRSSKAPTEEDVKYEKAKRGAELKLKAAKADRAKLEADELKGSMHRSEDVKAITEDMLYAVRNGLMALPGRLAVDVIGCETAAQAYEIIKREAHALMKEFAEYKYDPERYEEAVRARMEWGAEGLIDDE